MLHWIVLFVDFYVLTCVALFRHDFQFFNTQRLSELYEKEVRHLMVGASATLKISFSGQSTNHIFIHLFIYFVPQQANQKNQGKDAIEVDEREGIFIFYNIFFIGLISLGILLMHCC